MKLNSKFFSLVLACITNQKPNLNQNLFCSFLLKKQGRKNFSGGFNIKPQLKMGHPVHFLYLLLHIIINVTFLKKKTNAITCLSPKQNITAPDFSFNEHFSSNNRQSLQPERPNHTYRCVRIRSLKQNIKRCEAGWQKANRCNRQDRLVRWRYPAVRCNCPLA